MSAETHGSWHELYTEEILGIGDWSLRRKDGGSLVGNYVAMMGHNCPVSNKFTLINGEWDPKCALCKQKVPDEIWGLWCLLCNDQRRGFKSL